MIYLGADHAGFELKEELKKYLEELGYKYEDLGNKIFDKDDDYPDFAFKVAHKVIKEKGEGILICATGVGVSIAANKVKGIRAAIAWNESIARGAKEHNHANILCLGGKAITSDEAKKIIRAWLETKPSKAPRHLRRLNKITEKES